MKSRFNSMCSLKCPKCREGNLFLPMEGKISKAFDMHKRCPHCNQDFVIEPGFYYGAMFISYILSAFFSLAFMGVAMFVFHIYWETALMLLIGVLALGFVYLYRFSRSVWLYINV